MNIHVIHLEINISNDQILKTWKYESFHFWKNLSYLTPCCISFKDHTVAAGKNRRALSNRPTSQKQINEIDPLCCQIYTSMLSLDCISKLEHVLETWDWFRFCMRFCSLKAQNLVLKNDLVNRPTAVYSNECGISKIVKTFFNDFQISSLWQKPQT